MTDQETIEIETTPIDESVPGATALTAVERAAIDTQVATAKQYPRVVSKCIEDAKSLACMDEDTAASCFYSLPRGKHSDGSRKFVEGPTARLAEIMVSSWGNIRADADIVDEGPTHITAVGTCYDVEKNVAVRVRVRRRITDKHGARYNADMIGVTGMAAISIALRNAVFKVIPRALSDQIYKAARRTAVGSEKTIQKRIEEALAWFTKAGVDEDKILAELGVRAAADIGESELLVLRGLVNALQSGETTLDAVFRKHEASDGIDEMNQPSAASALPSKDDLVKQCETHFDMLSIQRASWLTTARELKVEVPEKAATLKGLSLEALRELETKLAKEMSGG